MWDTNKASRQEACTTYVGHRCLSILPKERRHWGLPGLILETQAKLAGLVSTHVPDGNSARKTGSKKETTRGNQSFQKLIRFLYFLGLFIYLLLYIRMNTESHGGQQTWPLSQSDASYKIIQRSNGFYIIFWPWGLLTFYDPFFSDNGQSTKKLIFQGWFFLNQAPPSEGTR